MIIRAQHTADAAVVRQLLTSAFKDAGRVADLAETLARRPDRPVPALVAEVDATLVAWCSCPAAGSTQIANW